MNQMQVFNHSMFGELPVLVVGGVEWFGGTESAKALGFSKPHDAIANHVDEEDSAVHVVLTSGGRQSKKFINESGLYSLIFGAAKQGNNPEIREKAKQFKRWVTSEVLPSIRKHGAYMTEDVLERSIQDPDFMIGLLTALKEERQKRIEAEKTVNILMHVNKTYTATEIAKELGFKSAQQLNKDLERRRIQYQQNGTWVLFSKYADKGYVEIKQEVLDNGKVIYHRRFTQLGREFLLKLYGINEGEVMSQ
ncbi:BRO family protein [Geobacillus stearothermophilus]|uniref:BRO family protein n=1 Tax=Geobacillus stearothermophilus TaxID=1422 RepID=UPI003D1BBC21